MMVSLYIINKTVTKTFSYFYKSFTYMRRPRLASKDWISLNELSRAFKLVTFLFGVSGYDDDVKLLYKRVTLLNEKSGSNFTFLYLKECSRLIIRYLAGSGEPRFNSKGIFVSRDSHGLPILLPPKLRQCLIDVKDQNMVKFILTLVGFYRVWPSVQRIKLSTLTEPFSGTSRHLDQVKINEALSELTKQKSFILRDMKFLKLETASPTGWLACWNSTSDVIALLRNPHKLIALLKFMKLTPVNVLIFTWLLSLMLLAVPWLIITSVLCRLPFLWIKRRRSYDVPFGFDGEYQTFGYRFYWLKFIINEITLVLTFGHLIFFEKMSDSLWGYQWAPFSKLERGHTPLGKLSVVYDQAGKGRVVAITNYWIQVWLKPLHDYLFSVLKDIEQDGTWDQLKPLDKLIAVQSEDSYHSFDLSAATDRLPLELQVQVLNALEPHLGDNWGSLLSINWLSPNKRHWVQYAVGQPMGAYSSWAMLAVTHHVIVRYSARKCGIESFQDYALLGDDIVIRNNLVAAEYLKIMDLLGVSINLSKSVISKDFAEFAKVWRGHKGKDYTPIGSGLLVRFLRDNNYLGVVLNEMFKTSAYKHYSASFKILANLKGPLALFDFLGLWSIFGLKGTMWKQYTSDVTNLRLAIGKILSSSHSKMVMQEINRVDVVASIYPVEVSFTSDQVFWNAVRLAQLDVFAENLRKLSNESKNLLKNMFRTSSRHWSLRFFENACRLISPGFYVYFVFLLKDSLRLYHEWHYGLGKDHEFATLDGAFALMDDKFSVTKVNWTDRKLIKDQSRYFRKIKKYYQFIYDNFDLFSLRSGKFNYTWDTLYSLPVFDRTNLRKGHQLPVNYCKCPKPFKPKVLGLPKPLALKRKSLKRSSR